MTTFEKISAMARRRYRENVAAIKIAGAAIAFSAFCTILRRRKAR